MSRIELMKTLRDEIGKLSIIDAHTHVVGGKLGARGLHDIMLAHMAVSDLYSAGCPSGSRLTQYPGWPSDEEAHFRIKEAIPFLPYVTNTCLSWCIRIILKDLYEWDQPITIDNWEKIDAIIREKADDNSWHREILDRGNIKKLCTEYARREDGADSDILKYSLEWAFFTRCQWGEYDTALYELERCWGKMPESPTPIGTGHRLASERVIKTIDDVHSALDWYVKTIPADKLVSMATHISTDIDLTYVTKDEMKEALLKRDTAGPKERDIYASYLNEEFLTLLEKNIPDLIFAFSIAAEPLPYETSSRITQKTIAQIGEMISRHKKLKFHAYLSSHHANQSMCTLCRELPNLSLIGYWWHNFFPLFIRQVMEERLDMLPTNKQIGFFSDAYCVEISYAKSVIVKNEMVRLLADKIESGQYTLDMAVQIAHDTLFESSRTSLGL